MTLDFGLGVRYRAAGESAYVVQPVENAVEQATLLNDLRARGLEADPVALTWQVMADPSRTTGDTR